MHYPVKSLILFLQPNPAFENCAGGWLISLSAWELLTSRKSFIISPCEDKVHWRLKVQVQYSREFTQTAAGGKYGCCSNILHNFDVCHLKKSAQRKMQQEGTAAVTNKTTVPAVPIVHAGLCVELKQWQELGPAENTESSLALDIWRLVLN